MKFITKSLLIGSAGLALLAGNGLSVFADDVETDAQETEEIVVTATRLATPTEQVGSSMSVITAEDMDRRQDRTVYDALRQVEGMHIARSGGPGAQTSSYIRGMDSSHTKVMIDGVMVNDPSLMGRSFEFSHLTTDNIERIEFIRGPQSTLYGSDAMGGVVNIITEKGEGPPSVTLSTEYGGYDTSLSRFSVGGAQGPVSYHLGGSYTDSRGFSHADDPDGDNDSYRNRTFYSRLGLQALDNLKFDLMYNYESADSEYDEDAFVDADNKQYSTRNTVRGQATLDLADGLWEQVIGIGHNDMRRSMYHTWGTDRFRGKYMQVDWQHNLYLHDRSTLTLGGEWEEEKYDNDFDARTSTTSGFVQKQLEPIDDLYLTGGMRIDSHEDFGSKTTYRLSSAYLLRNTDTKFRGSFGTGFKAPSLYQLYAPATDFGFGPTPLGNQDLDPEESRGWDVGVEQVLISERLQAEITYFENRIDDLIDWDPTVGYKNINEAETYGFETGLSAKMVDSLTGRLGYTYTRAKDKDTREELLRRPKDRIISEFQYNWNDRSSVTLSGHFVGRRYDVDNVRLGSYTLLNLAASHEIHNNVTIFGRIENLTREDYEEVAGYNTPGRAIYGGLQARF